MDLRRGMAPSARSFRHTRTRKLDGCGGKLTIRTSQETAMRSLLSNETWSRCLVLYATLVAQVTPSFHTVKRFLRTDVIRSRQCSTENPAGARFCNACGQPLAGAAPSAAVVAYTPKHLAEKILTSKVALEGERKHVTVLFADMKGSTELLADRDPEEARTLLDPVLERMMEAVHRYEGTVNQVMGDGIMALFGAPLAHEDHAVRACYAALRMQESVKKYAEDVRRSHAAVVKIRVGLNSGEVVVRAIGSDLHMDYTAVGQTTHLAARMEQIADPGSILLTRETLRLAEDFVEVRPLGPVPVKGLAESVEIYELVGVTALRRRLQAAVARGLSPFVGR